MRDSSVQEAPALLRIDQVARLLSVGRSKTYAMAQSGELPGVVRIGSAVRVNRKRLEEWIDQQPRGGSDAG